MEDEIKFYKVIGKNIKKIRLSQNLTIREFSKRTGISKNRLLKIENGENHFRTTTFGKICNGLSIAPKTLFT